MHIEDAYTLPRNPYNSTVHGGGEITQEEPGFQIKDIKGSVTYIKSKTSVTGVGFWKAN
jgi:hypothetical protein